MDSETTKIEILSERINAQIEAHEKYSQAFIRILETLDQINERIAFFGGDDAEHLRELQRELVRLTEELKHLRGEIAPRLDDVVAQIAAISNVISQGDVRVSTDIMALIGNLQESHREFAIYRKQMEDHRAKMEPTVEQIAAIYENGQLANRFKAAVINWGSALFALIAIIESLIQLGLLRFTWGH